MALDPLTVKNVGDRQRILGDHIMLIAGKDPDGGPVIPQFDADGNLKVNAQVSAETTLEATAAAPSYSEGQNAPGSQDLSGNTRTRNDRLETLFGAVTSAPVADNTTVASATAADGISLWKRLVNLGIAILAKLPTIGTSRTPALSALTSGSGSISAGGQSIGIITSSDWVGTIGGASFPANASMSWTANPGDTVGALAYTRSAGTLYAGTLT